MIGVIDYGMGNLGSVANALAFLGAPARVLKGPEEMADCRALILPGVVTSYNIFLAKQFFTSIPTPLIESAKLDGCSQPKIFVSIILPLSKTVLAVMAINTFLSTWNSFFWPFLVTSQESMYTIQVGLKQFKFANTTLFGPMMAGATVSAMPMFILFVCLQRYFLEGVTVGAVKG